MEKEAGKVPQFADQPVFAVDFDGHDLHADHVSVSVDFLLVRERYLLEPSADPLQGNIPAVPR